MKKINLTLLFLCYLLTLQAQGWDRRTTSFSHNVLELANGDLITFDTRLTRYSAEGELLAEYELPETDTSNFFITTLKELPDQRLAFAGQTTILPTDDLPPKSPITYGIMGSDGGVEWQKVVSLGDELIWDLATDLFIDEGHLVIGGSYDWDSQAFLLKVDLQGEEVWFKTYEQITSNFATTKLEFNTHPAGGYTFHGTAFFEGQRSLVLARADHNGELLWHRIFNGYTGSTSFAVNALALAPNGHYFLSSVVGLFGDYDMQFLETDPNGVLVNTYLMEAPGSQEIGGFISTSDGGFLIAGSDSEGPFGNSDMVLMKLNGNLEEQWKQYYGSFLSDRGMWIQELANGDLLMVAGKGRFSTSIQSNNTVLIPWLYRTNSEGQVSSNKLEGNIFNDLDLSCLNEEEASQIEWLVRAEGAQETYYEISDSSGNYCLPLSTGDYTVALTLPSPYWGTCDNEVPISLVNADTAIIDFATQAIIDCPYMEVDIAAPFLRRCFPNEYYVSYCNKGTVTGENAYIEVELDQFLLFEDATRPWMDLGDNTYRFDLGDVAAGYCGRFKIEVLLDEDCEATLLGQTHCVEAHIYPDTLCLSTPDWSGASIEVDAQCTGDSVLFSITNVGNAPTSESLNYIVIVDQVILLEGNFNLGPGESRTIAQPADGTTKRLEAQQEPNHPGNSMPSITVEGCGDDNGQISLGFVTQYSQNDGDPFISIDCQENQGAFDPNDKRAFPKGYGEENYIEANTDIDYHIRFQNTGTDTAFTVVIRDPIAETLDLSTLKVGSSSHPYRVAIEPDRVLVFYFENILLPDSTTNEPASHGFVQFKISQSQDLSPGTEILNKAAIYFDFNEPIFTNGVVLRIEEDFILVSIEEPSVAEPASVQVFPNPFREATLIEVPSLLNRAVTLKLFDLSGRLIREETYPTGRFQLERKQLPEGMYLFQLSSRDGFVHTGKIVVQ